jgi:hypothetical protein
MPDSKAIVSNGMAGRTRSMVRMTLAIPRQVLVLPTEFELPYSPSVAWDGKEIVFIAKMPAAQTRSLR